MQKISKIKTKNLQYCVAGAAVLWIASLFFLGLNVIFPYGLALGTAVALVGMHVLAATIEGAARSGRKAPLIVGYVLRIVLYGGALYIAFKTGTAAGVGAAAGLLLPRVMLPIQQLLVPKLLVLLGKAPKTQHYYKKETSGRRFEKTPRMVLYRRGRAYLTHRRFPVYRLVEVEVEKEAAPSWK